MRISASWLLLAAIVISGCSHVPESAKLDVTANVSMGVDDSQAGLPLPTYNLNLTLTNIGEESADFDKATITLVSKSGETIVISEDFLEGKSLGAGESYEFDTDTRTATWDLTKWGQKANLIVTFGSDGHDVLGAHYVQLPDLESLPRKDYRNEGGGIKLRLKEMHGITKFDEDGNPVGE